jgi:hypothetical protein
MGSEFVFLYFYYTGKISKIAYLLNTENLTYNSFYLTKYIFILTRKNNLFLPWDKNHLTRDIWPNSSQPIKFEIFGQKIDIFGQILSMVNWPDQIPLI